MTWTDEVIARLRELFARNLSSGRIAEELKLTRNQVVGKLDRLGLQRVGPTIGLKKPKREPAPKKETPRKIPKSVHYEMAVADVVPLHVELIDLEHDQCRYPYGDGPFTFCGCPKIDGSSYCGPHHTLTHGDHRLPAQQVAMNKRAYRAEAIARVAA
jgi:GcrA cell cycle regulator